MIIKNGSVYQEDKTFVKKDLYIENGFIVESAAGALNRWRQSPVFTVGKEDKLFVSLSSGSVFRYSVSLR